MRVMTAIKEAQTYQTRYVRGRLVVLFDLLIMREPEIVRGIVDQILDASRDRWMEQRVRRRWARELIRSGSHVVRPFSRRMAVRYVSANLSEAVVDAILNEIERMVLEQELEKMACGKSNKLAAGEDVVSTSPTHDEVALESAQPPISRSSLAVQGDRDLFPRLVLVCFGFCLGVFATYSVLVTGKGSPKSTLPASSYVASQFLDGGVPSPPV